MPETATYSYNRVVAEARDRFGVPHPEDTDAAIHDAQLVKNLDEAIDAKNEKDIADDLQQIIDEF